MMAHARYFQQLADEDSRLRCIDNPGANCFDGSESRDSGGTGRSYCSDGCSHDYAADYVRQCVEVLEETGADNVGRSMGCQRTRTWRGQSPQLFSLRSPREARVDMTQTMREKSIQFISAAGPVRSLIESECLMKNSCETRMTNLI